MKPLIFSALVALLALAPLCSFAQSDTTYFDQDWNKTVYMSAHYYRIATKQSDGLYKVEDHYLFGSKLQNLQAI